MCPYLFYIHTYLTGQCPAQCSVWLWLVKPACDKQYTDFAQVKMSHPRMLSFMVCTIFRPKPPVTMCQFFQLLSGLISQTEMWRMNGLPFIPLTNGNNPWLFFSWLDVYPVFACCWCCWLWFYGTGELFLLIMCLQKIFWVRIQRVVIFVAIVVSQN